MRTFMASGLLCSSWKTSGSLSSGSTLVISFFLRNFYFVYTELHWGGQTLGKRWLKLRVISRDGGPLTAEAIFPPLGATRYTSVGQTNS